MTGFRPSRNAYLTGSPNIRQFRVTVGASNTYYVGDPVSLAAGTGRVVPSTAATSSAFLGVIVGVGKEGPQGEFLPLTFNQPAGGMFLAASTTGIVLVNTDPSQVYLASFAGTGVSAGLIGKNVRGSAGTPNSRAGVSGWTLAGATVGTAAGNMWRIVGIAPTELINGYLGDKASGTFVEVKPNRAIMAFETDAGV